MDVTKTRLTPSQIQDIAKHAYGAAPNELEFNELTHGYYNVAYLLTTEHGPCVIKVAPRPSVRVLRYEHNILEAEVRVLTILSRRGAPLRTPRVLGYDPSCTIVEAPYAILEYLPGENLHMRRASLSERDSRAVDEACGRHLRFVNGITRESCGDGSEFGYCAADAPRYPTWHEAFRNMVLDLLADARDGDVEDIPHEEIIAALNTHAAAFDEITDPRLVIWDLWDGNLLVSGGTVTGTIDYERALWGDPLMETAFRGLEAPLAAGLVEAYGRYRPGEWTREERWRGLFYDLHLSLIRVIQVTFRGLRELERGGKDMEVRGRMGIRKALDELRS